MEKSTHTIAQQIAEAVTIFQQQCTGHAPSAVNVVLSEDTLVITLHDALSPAEKALVQKPAGAAQVQEYHRQLFAESSASLRQEIKRSRTSSGEKYEKPPLKWSLRPVPWCRHSQLARWCRCFCSPRTSPGKWEIKSNRVRSLRKGISDMLVLSRKVEQSIAVGGATGFEPLLKITVLEIGHGTVKLGFEVDASVPVHRWEVWERILDQSRHDTPADGLDTLTAP